MRRSSSWRRAGTLVQPAAARVRRSARSGKGGRDDRIRSSRTFRSRSEKTRVPRCGPRLRRGASVRACARAGLEFPPRFTRPDATKAGYGPSWTGRRPGCAAVRSTCATRSFAATCRTSPAGSAPVIVPTSGSTLVRTPYFNASMAPNGMMQVWSGLLLRVDNEAQLAAVLGHEIGHYLARHSVERLRDEGTCRLRPVPRNLRRLGARTTRRAGRHVRLFARP